MAVSNGPRQLALALGYHESLSRDDFLEGPSNSAALLLVDRWPDWPNRVVVLTGPQGSGKSHLASIWAENAGARFLSGRHLGEDDLPRAVATGALVIEDLAADSFDERALFHLLNLAAEHTAWVLITARAAPATFSVQIPDLLSRLRALPVVGLAAPDDVLLRAVLIKLLADRQVRAQESLIKFLVTRIERSFAAAQEAVARLDQESIRLQRPVTRALAAELFR